MKIWIFVVLLLSCIVAFALNRRRIAFDHRPRPLQLVCVVAAVIVLAVSADYVLTGDRLVRQFFWPETVGSKVPEWKDLFQALLLLMGLPVALLIWHWRDRNAHHQIENARADLSLREFQELQIRAAGGFEPEIPIGARVALQVASLHQLRPYLRGGYGISFRLAAFELFCSMLEAEMEKVGGEGRAGRKAVAERTPELIVPRRVYLALREIVFEDWEAFFLSGFSLAQRSLKKIKIPEKASLTGVNFSHADLSGASFAGATLISCKFDEALLDSVVADGCKIEQCSFKKSRLTGSSFVGSRLYECSFFESVASRSLFYDSKLISTKIINSDIDGSSFKKASIDNSDIINCSAKNSNFEGAVLRRSRLNVVDVDLVGNAKLKFDYYSLLSYGTNYEAPARHSWPLMNLRDILEEDPDVTMNSWLAAGAELMAHSSRVDKVNSAESEIQNLRDEVQDWWVRSSVTAAIIALIIGMAIVAIEIHPSNRIDTSITRQ